MRRTRAVAVSIQATSAPTREDILTLSVLRDPGPRKTRKFGGGLASGTRPSSGKPSFQLSVMPPAGTRGKTRRVHFAKYFATFSSARRVPEFRLSLKRL